MDEQVFEALARAAGLEIALRDFRADVMTAAADAAAKRDIAAEPADPRAEPWPPMQPGIGL